MAKLNLTFPPDFNTGLVVIEGAIKINGKETAYADSFVHFKNKGEAFSIEAVEDSVFPKR